jgi:hypothetical protein
MNRLRYYPTTAGAFPLQNLQSACLHILPNYMCLYYGFVVPVLHSADILNILLLLVPRNFNRGRGVIPSLAERGGGSSLVSVSTEFGM